MENEYIFQVKNVDDMLCKKSEIKLNTIEYIPTQLENTENENTNYIPNYDELEGLYGEEYLRYYGVFPPNVENE